MASLFCQRTISLSSRSSAARTFDRLASVKGTSRTAAFTQRSNPAQFNHVISRAFISTRIPVQWGIQTPGFARHASSGSTVTASRAGGPADALTWDRFFDLRRKRRWINLGASLITAATSVGVIAPLLAQYDFDTWGAQTFGLDPIIVLGISTFAVAAAGWLCGPAFGNTAFSFWAGRKGWGSLIATKEKTFYARIKRYRADPSASSPQNPIPDYYGEKIGSVKDYRRWLKDQRAFNLKKNKNMI